MPRMNEPLGRTAYSDSWLLTPEEIQCGQYHANWKLHTMDVPEITEVIDAMDDAAVETLLALFADEALTVVRPPGTGLMMLTVKDSFETGFHLGEILVTEARVQYRGCDGYGLVMGEAPRKAMARAAADAVLRCKEPAAIQQKVRDCLVKHAAERASRLAEEALLAAATTVNFDLMPGA